MYTARNATNTANTFLRPEKLSTTMDENSPSIFRLKRSCQVIVRYNIIHISKLQYIYCYNKEKCIILLRYFTNEYKSRRKTQSTTAIIGKANLFHDKNVNILKISYLILSIVDQNNIYIVVIKKNKHWLIVLLKYLREKFNLFHTVSRTHQGRKNLVLKTLCSPLSAKFIAF